MKCRSELLSVVPAGLAENLVIAEPVVRLRDRVVEWRVESVRDTEGGGRIVQLRDSRSALEAKVEIRFAPSHRAAVLTTTLHNQDPKPFGPIALLSPVVVEIDNAYDALIRTMGGGMSKGAYPPPSYMVRTYIVREGMEPLMVQSGLDGRSSNRDMPLYVIAAHGGGLAMGLEWSGLWRTHISTSQRLRIDAEVEIDGRNLVLAPGESLPLPPMHLVFFEGDLEAGGNALRRYVRDRVMPRLGGQPVTPPVFYDHFFGIECEFDETFLRRQADVAAELGAEYFVLDGAWPAGSRGRTDFNPCVGNWTRPDPEKLPRGIEPLADHVRQRGMHFGLWLDVERAHRSSDYVREHPDWFLDLGTDFLHFNFAIPAAVDHLSAMLTGMVERYDVHFFRWDYNIGPRPFWNRFDETGRLMFEMTNGLYRVLDRLNHRFPKLMIENCASGGRRTDLGMLRRSHVCWFSDQTVDPHVCRFMQTGQNHFLPGSLANSAISVEKAGVRQDLQAFDFLSHMLGSFVLSGDIAAWNKRAQTRARKMVAIFKEYRHLLMEDFYPLTRHPKHIDDWDVVQFVTPDGRESVMLAFRVYDGAPSLTVKLRGLSAEAAYEVRNPLSGETRTKTGQELMEKGLRFRLRPHDTTLCLLKRR